MDSLTQMALGASLSVAVMGRRTAAWKAAAWGAVAGTLPDLDVLLQHGDPVLDMVLHRAESHSLLYLTLLAGPLGWLAAWATSTPQLRGRWMLALFAALFTHPLLDLMTVYGTQVLQPFTDEAYGVGSLFIIDPAYTLPLLAGVGAALWWQAGKGLWVNGMALVLSTAYIGWSVLAQGLALEQARQALRAQGIQPTRILATPAPLNTLLWRIVVMEDNRYLEGHWSVFDSGRPLSLRAYPRDAALLAQQAAHPHVQRLARFSDGFFSLTQDAAGHLWLTDLRMGQEPAYVFRFDLGPPPAPGQPVPRSVQATQRFELQAGLRWLWARALGGDVQPPGVAP